MSDLSLNLHEKMSAAIAALKKRAVLKTM
uniref:Uncharacterized protein n=1 Tax=Arundo donax TaxID=35708 RepID=A0A0A8Y277_ARUDO